MSLELRGGIRAAPVLGDDPAEREALRFVPDPRVRDADPEHVVATATGDERDGIDSVLVTQSSSWPDPWAVAGWSLAATRRLRIVLAHRIGQTAPTVAARALVTLDRLSSGRAGVHLILGSSDDDVLRDGDGLDKAERYERAAEFLDVFERTLTAREPFDVAGRHYRVRDAYSGVRGPDHEPPARPEISFAGSSDAGIALAARHADVYGIAVQDPELTRAQIERVRAEAREHGREIRIWANARFVLGEDDERAHAKADAIVDRAAGLRDRVDDLDWIRRVRPADAPPPTAAAFRERVRASVASATIGSPETAAEAVDALRRIGVDVVQLSTPLETPADHALRRALIGEIRARAAAPVPAG